MIRRERVDVHVVTLDSFGTSADQLKGIVDIIEKLKTTQHHVEKQEYVVLDSSQGGHRPDAVVEAPM